MSISQATRDTGHPAIEPVVYRALSYQWHSSAWLDREQAAYGLAALWQRIAGDADWQGEPVIRIPAVTGEAIELLHAQRADQIEWVDVVQRTAGQALPIDRQLPSVMKAAVAEAGEAGDLSEDLVALTFWLLSRWEDDHASLPRDGRGNVRESARWIVRCGLSHRPILDEWAMVLRSIIQQRMPRWSPQLPEFVIVPTHDVDMVRFYRTFLKIPRRCYTYIRNTRDLWGAVVLGCGGLASKLGLQIDPAVSGLALLSELDRRLGASGRFFLMSSTASRYDDGYAPASPLVGRMVEQLQQAGHHVGWHPGYRAAESDWLFADEHQRLIRYLPGADQIIRFHYLRWRGHSLDWLEQAGVQRDYSWGMNDHVGFMVGTCHPFQIWDHGRHQAGGVTEIPLLVQEDAMFPSVDAFTDPRRELLNQIIDRVGKVNGQYTFLIHNTTPFGQRHFDRMIEAMYGPLGLDHLKAEGGVGED